MFGSYAQNGTGVFTEYINENSFIISNDGSADLIITSFRLNESWLTLSGYPNLPFAISPNSSQTVSLEVDWSSLVLQETATVTINSNDLVKPTVIVSVTAIPNGDPTQYTVLTSSNPVTGGTTSGSGTFNENSDVTVVATANSGWSFVNWTENSNQVADSNSSSYKFTLTKDRDLVANFKKSGCQPNWVPVVYTNSTTAYGKVKIEDVPAESGDVVGAFVSGECRAVGDVVFNQGEAFVTLLIQGDQVETVNFKIFDSSECLEVNVCYSTQTSPGGTIGNPPNYLPINSCPSTIIQTLALNSRWNLKSFYVTPDTTTTKSIFRPIVSVLGEVKDLTKSYNPSVPDFLNTLINIESTSGYWVYVSEDVTLDVDGTPIDCSNLQISLKTNWNLVGYPCQKENDIKLALSSIMSELEEVKDLTKSYNPSVPDFLNTLTKLVPGSGYWMKVKKDVTLTYPTPTGLAKSNNIVETIKYDKWKPAIYTNSMVVYTQIEINEAQVTSGLVGAFVEGECRGIGTIVNNEGSSYATIVVNGEKAGKLTFKLYDATTEEEVIVENQIDFTPGRTESDIVLLKGYTEEYVESLIPTTTKLYYAYPNPFNPSTEIKFDLHKESKVNLSVYNLRGELVNNIISDFYAPGSYSYKWNGNNSNNSKVSSGVYIIQFRTNEKSYSNKVILLK